MPVSRQQAVLSALQSRAYPVGMCARWTRERFGLPALGDHDKDGDADAVDMWAASVLKEAGDRNPPAGVPVFWSGGSAGRGHAAISLGDGFVRTIDRPTSGTVSTVPLAEIEQAWGLKYLGWTIDLYGHEIPDPEGDLRRLRLDKLARSRRRKAKWQRWVKKANANIRRLKGLTK